MSEHPQRAAYLADQRWFAGKGRDFAVADVRVLGTLGERVRIELVDVEYAEGEPARETYQMPVIGYAEPQEHLAHALIRQGDGEWTYDALHDRAAMSAYLEAFAGVATPTPPAETSAEQATPPVFHTMTGVELDTEVHSTLFTGEQSNSSVAFGETAMLKVFRKVTTGHNPDIEIHRALTEAGNTHVAHLLGWVADGETDLAMLQEFLRTATDGWELGLASVRNLFAEGDLHAEEVGGDFASEAERLGESVAEVHADLREAFGEAELDTAALAKAMHERLDAAVEVVPGLGEHAGALHAIFDGPADAALPAQRVHGDLHLGQTLRTSLGWKLVDFEGEPAKPLEERRRFDSSWRDVAGMLRSFDYAAQVVLQDLAPDASQESQLAYRAGEWTERNLRAFVDGYAPDGPTAAERALITAYVADKAVYECVYEARNRPAWLTIPLRAIGRLTS